MALALLAACTPAPEDVTEDLRRAFVAGDVSAIEGAIDPGYADPLGDRDVLLDDLHMLVKSFARRSLTFTDLGTSKDASKLVSTVTGRLDLELVGAPTWRVTGPTTLDFVRTDRFRVHSGLLPHVRDILGLMAARREALESNDPARFGQLLHPQYRDGDLDADGAVARFTKDTAGVAIRIEPTNYRVEVRGPLAHVDEHYILRVGERTLAPSIARFTLKRAAGRWKIAAGLYGRP